MGEAYIIFQACLKSKSLAKHFKFKGTSKRNMAETIHFSSRRLTNMIEEKKQKHFHEMFCKEDPDQPKFNLYVKFSKDSLGIFLRNKSKEKIFVVNYCITLVSNKKVNDSNLLRKLEFTNHFLEPAGVDGDDWGWTDTVTVSKLKECIVLNANWEVKQCEFTYTGDYKEHIESAEPQDARMEIQSLSSNLARMFESEIDADVTFSFKNKGRKKNLIKAHKCILKVRSTYFERLFESGMKECSDQVIEIDDCPYEEYREMIKFLYTDLPPPNLDEIAASLLPIADKYMIPKLKLHCQKALKRTLNDENLKEVLLLAHQFNCPILKAACFAKIPNMKMVAGWKELKDCGDLLLEYLQYASNQD